MTHCCNCNEPIVSEQAYCLECCVKACGVSAAQAQFWSANNPLFVLLRVVIVMGFLTLILFVNAANFNYTEHRIIAAMFIVVAVGESAWAIVRKMIGKG